MTAQENFRRCTSEMIDLMRVAKDVCFAFRLLQARVPVLDKLSVLDLVLRLRDEFQLSVSMMRENVEKLTTCFVSTSPNSMFEGTRLAWLAKNNCVFSHCRLQVQDAIFRRMCSTADLEKLFRAALAEVSGLAVKRAQTCPACDAFHASVAAYGRSLLDQWIRDIKEDMNGNDAKIRTAVAQWLLDDVSNEVR
jgi:hypothetical protein